MNVAVIPARGGSKRIPRKNVRVFAGKPMIAHSIERALESRLFERVIISTDDEEISRVARDYGAEVPFVRPADLSDDHAGVTEVLAHATQYLLDQGTELAAVCCVYATAPFMRTEDLEKGLALLQAGDLNFVFSASTFSYPIFRAFTQNAKGELEMLFPEHFPTRSQDLPEAMHDAAQFCWGRPEAWLSRARVFAKGSAVVRIPHWRAQDIDTEDDWARAELMASCLGAE